jgi:hypothetical protein
MHYSYTGVGIKTFFLSRSTQKCFTPTLGENTKNMLDRSTHQINAPKFLLLPLKGFIAEKEACGYAKVIHKKEKKLKKIDKCSRYLKQWVLRCPSKKKETNKIAYVFL